MNDGSRRISLNLTSLGTHVSGPDASGSRPLPSAADNGYSEIPDLLSQGIAIEAKHGSRFQLISLGRIQRQHDQGPFYLTQDTVVQPRRRQIVAVGREIGAQVALDRIGKVFTLVGIFLIRPGRAVVEGQAAGRPPDHRPALRRQRVIALIG